MVDVESLQWIAKLEFADLVAEAVVPGPNTLRLILLDDSFIEVWFSLRLRDRYSYHWERRAISFPSS